MRIRVDASGVRSIRTSPMSSPTNSPTSVEVITLDTSVEDVSSQNGSLAPNLTANAVDTTIDIDTTQVVFEETLPPGMAPEGFVVLDESLMDTSRLTVSSADETDAPDPIFKVVFRDVSAFRSYHRKIERFLKELLSPKRYDKRNNVTSSTTDLVLHVFDSDSNCKNTSELDSSVSIVEETHSSDALFTVETVPKKQDDLDVPMFEKKFKKALEQSTDDGVEAKEDFGPRMTCFNCLGNHSLRDCDQPRNYGAISKNRKEYASKRGPSNARYHLDDDQRFGHFTPGKLSSNLRKALGIKEYDLPNHIYRMRELGYPPGWLEEARLQHSGLTLFNSEGRAEQGSDEEGEIVLPGDKDKYDIKKIIDYPGFNILTPQGTRDDGQEYWGSSMQIQYSKTAMVSYLSDKKTDDGYKRRKLPNPANAVVKTDINPGEMDIDELGDTSVECLPVKHLFIPPLPKESLPEVPPPPPGPPGVEDSDSQSQEEVSINSNDESTAPSSRDVSPSLGDLESKHQQLLAELDDSSSPSNPDSAKTGVSNPDSSETGIPELDSSKTEESDTNKMNLNNSTPNESDRKVVKSTHVGTPILHSASPYRRLPASEKFSKDICDVINFENLPDSTGKYDQMSELLQRVRSAVAELQKE